MPWDILGLGEPTQDKKQIKRAYAQLIKLNRPDEKPEEFQKIHQAYKYALVLAEELNNHAPPNEEIRQVPQEQFTDQPTETFPTPTLEDDNDDISITNEDSLQVLDSNESQPEEIDFSREQKSLLAIASQTLENTQSINNIRSWEFIVECEHLFNASFNYYIGEALFEQFSEFNHAAFSLEGEVGPHLEPKTLKYLNDFFDWSGQRDYFYDRFEKDYCDSIFNLLDYQERSTAAITIGGTTVENKAYSKQVGKTFFVVTLIIAFVLVLLTSIYS